MAEINIPINSKTIGTIITTIVLVSGVIGSWYTNSASIENIETTLARVENESKDRDSKLESVLKDNVKDIRSKIEQIEQSVHGTELTIGSIAIDVKNITENIKEIKDDIKSLRRRNK